MMSPFLYFCMACPCGTYRRPLELHSGTHICLLLIRRLIFYVLARIISSCLPSVPGVERVEDTLQRDFQRPSLLVLALLVAQNKEEAKESRVDNGAHSGGL